MNSASPRRRSTSGAAQSARAFITGLQAKSRGALAPATVIAAALRSRGRRPTTGGEVLVLGPVGTGKASPLHPLAVPAELHTGGRTHHWDIGRPDTKNDPGFLGRAFQHLDDETL